MTARLDSHVTAWRDWRYGQAHRFLNQLDAEAEAFTFQTFDDTQAKRRELARITHGALDDVAAELDNLQQQRAGVFVTVAATDGKGRQAHNIKRVRAVFVDLDGAPLKPVLEAGLAPHIVCESSRGRFHAYWLTDDCPLDQFERVQRALARRFGGDPSVHDLPRVMRLPGFRHFKHDAQTCKLLDELGCNAPPYALAEIVGALKLELDAPENKAQGRPNGDGNKIERGNRHDHLFASGRSMARRGLSREAVRAALAAENQARCDPPLPDADIDYLAGRAFTAKAAQGWQADATAPASAEHQPDTENAPAGDSASPDRLEPPAPEAAADGKDGKDDRPTTAKVLIDIAVKNCDLFHDERNDGYAVIVHNGIRRTLKLRGREFKRWLAGTYYDKTDHAANNEAIATAMSVLEAKATYDGRQLELANRFAMRDATIYIDMADAKWRVIKVTADGWEVMDKPPILFRRYSHQQALPDPVRGCKLSDLHKHLAIKSDNDKLLVEGWAVAVAVSGVPRPAITSHGPQGASKTTFARVLKSITDPSVTPSVDLGKAPADLAQVLDHHGIPCFDNVTSIPSWAADMLCRAVTGGAFSKRELYSDDSDILMVFQRAMIITGINIPTHAPDLLDRLLLIELERIQPEHRVDESTFWVTFNAARPKLFGALLDAIAGALRHLPNIKPDRMPRMADFARIACAYAEYAGVGSNKMLDIIMQHSSRQTEEILEADPVASAIRDFVQKRQSWTGTASELLKLLNEAPGQRPDGWPKQGNTLSRKLNILHTTLNDAGISISRDKEGSKRNRQLTLESKPDLSSASSVSSASPIHAGFEADDKTRPSSATSKTSSAPDDKAHAVKASSVSSSALNPSIHAGLDDKDDQDDKSALLSSGMVEVEV